MLGERSEQRASGRRTGCTWTTWVRTPSTAVGLLAGATVSGTQDFAEFYCADNGRDSVPPSLLATALLLQTHDKVSDAEAKARADFDIRWKVALGIEIEDRPFARATLRCFGPNDSPRQGAGGVRVQPAPGPAVGLPEKSGMRVALDTTNILGRGRGEGHLQSAGGRDRQTHESLGVRGADQCEGMGQGPRVRSGIWTPA